MAGKAESNNDILPIRLSKGNLTKIKARDNLSIPGRDLLSLPEKVLQFGTGVLLRGLPDYFIDKANKQCIFNGRIVVVKSMSKGETDSFATQDGLYTQWIKGVEEGSMMEEAIINGSISRVLSAGKEWKTILACAHNPEMQLIISNTTEAGIVLTDDNITAMPPHSFPGKLTAFLYERYKAFGGSEEGGMVVIPTELISDNGSKLKSIVLQLAESNKLERSFIDWVTTANRFCNSLVDRIVPGKLSAEEQEASEEKLGYTDELMIMSEPFRLWAIESDDEKVREVLSFSRADENVIIAPSIEKFRELKLRLLNGTHSLSCAVALFAGFETVKAAMADQQMSAFIEKLVMTEIASSMDDAVVSYNEACAFADKVLDRFRNPFLQHKWLSISLHYTSKMKMRVIPLLVKYFNKTGKVPSCMALGFAAYILFMKCRKEPNGAYYGEINGRKYLLEDEAAGKYADLWLEGNTDTPAEAVLSNKALWGYDLSLLGGFLSAVKENINIIRYTGISEAISNCGLPKIQA